MSIMELIIGMTLLGLISTLCAMIFISTVRTQTDVSNAALGSSAAQTFTGSLTKNVRTAKHFKVTSSIRLDIRTANDRCMAYVVYNGKIYRKVSSSAVGNFALTGWVPVLSNVQRVGVADYFTNSTAVGVKYSISAGKGISHIDLVGIATPRVVQASAAPCW